MRRFERPTIEIPRETLAECAEYWRARRAAGESTNEKQTAKGGTGK